MIKNRSVAAGLDQAPICNITLSGILRLANELRLHKYKPNPIRRVAVTKLSGRFSPLGIANFKDKIVQKSLFLILNPLYNPLFSYNSHGFRPGKSIHTCLNQIKIL
jgi:retron-type reverse transcriptase